MFDYQRKCTWDTFCSLLNKLKVQYFIDLKWESSHFLINSLFNEMFSKRRMETRNDLEFLHYSKNLFLDLGKICQFWLAQQISLRGKSAACFRGRKIRPLVFNTLLTFHNQISQSIQRSACLSQVNLLFYTTENAWETLRTV